MTEPLNKHLASHLRKIGAVLQAEHNWMKSRVEASRKTDDENTAYMLEKGIIDQQEADQKRGEDDLVLQRSEVDHHLQNLRQAPHLLSDAADIIEGLLTEVAAHD